MARDERPGPPLVAPLAEMGVRVGRMDATQPGLFELPEQDLPAVARRRAVCGRNRETWACTATAVVTIIDAAAVREAAARLEGLDLTIALGANPDLGETEPRIREPSPANDALDALAWLIWPTDGLEELLEVGAFRILSTDSEVRAETDDRGTVTSRVTVKLTDVDALRRFAANAHPEDAALIADSLEVAWQHAADPFAPLRSIPGISWRPGCVYVEHRGAIVAGKRSRK